MVRPQHARDDLLKRPRATSQKTTPPPLTSRGQQMVTPPPAGRPRGVAAFHHTSGRVEKKGPSDHLPLAFPTMGSVLPECAEGRLAFVPTRPGGGAAKALCPPIISFAVCGCGRRGSSEHIRSYESHKRDRKAEKKGKK